MIYQFVVRKNEPIVDGKNRELARTLGDHPAAESWRKKNPSDDPPGLM